MAWRQVVKRVFTVATVGIALLIGMTGCDPKGQACNHKGDTLAQGGHVYHCEYDPSVGNTWQYLSVPQPTPFPSGWKPTR